MQKIEAAAAGFRSADLEVAPHEPEWLEIGNASICTRCGWVSFGEEAQP